MTCTAWGPCWLHGIVDLWTASMSLIAVAWMARKVWGRRR